MRWFWLAVLPLSIACSGSDDDSTGDDDDTVGDDDDTVGDDDDDTSALDGEALYAANCAVCHGADGEGASATDMMTALMGLTRDDVISQILDGGGLMPAVSVTEEEAGAITDYSIATWGM
jgi:mono/diheme cytochrome c family protein